MISPDTLMLDIIRLKTEVEQESFRLHRLHIETGEKETKVFDAISLRIPEFRSAELSLLRAVSWFYVWYYETGRVSIQFLQSKLSNYSLDSDNSVEAHLKLVDRLRTYFQHNLKSYESHDIETWIICETWFKQQCTSATPQEEEHWQSCLIGFLKEARFCIEVLRRCLIAIKDDAEYRSQVLQEWKTKISRYHPPYEFDQLIAIVCFDIGRSTIDHAKLRKRFYEQWSQSLKALHGNYDFNVEARKLIEYTLLNEVTRQLPLTGKDIMSEFDLPAGPKIGELLEKAKSLYEASPCLKEELLDQLRRFL